MMLMFVILLVFFVLLGYFIYFTVQKRKRHEPMGEKNAKG
jgi:hypothetical protein